MTDYTTFVEGVKQHFTPSKTNELTTAHNVYEYREHGVLIHVNINLAHSSATIEFTLRADNASLIFRVVAKTVFPDVKRMIHIAATKAALLANIEKDIHGYIFY